MWSTYLEELDRVGHRLGKALGRHVLLVAMGLVRSLNDPDFAGVGRKRAESERVALQLEADPHLGNVLRARPALVVLVGRGRLAVEVRPLFWTIESPSFALDEVGQDRVERASVREGGREQLLLAPVSVLLGAVRKSEMYSNLAPSAA